MTQVSCLLAGGEKEKKKKKTYCPEGIVNFQVVNSWLPVI
jgi:hypothetical protein